KRKEKTLFRGTLILGQIFSIILIISFGPFNASPILPSSPVINPSLRSPSNRSASVLTSQRRTTEPRRPASTTGIQAAAKRKAAKVGSFRMGTEDSKDMLKNADWKTVSGPVITESSQPIVKKRLPKKIRQVPECYFLPRRSLPSALAIYGAVCAAGVGAGMLLEVWINKKIKEDGGVVWEMGK
uniref:DPL2 protein n=2 Tax=Aegilops tauschii subsp. strangulata TaxID=200361 RepID=A0A453QYA8_AEGTS